MTEDEFIEKVIIVARNLNFLIEDSRNGRQIDFGHKKLHEGHLRVLYPEILNENANINILIDNVAPGRPCTHAPMRTIIAIIRQED